MVSAISSLKQVTIEAINIKYDALQTLNIFILLFCIFKISFYQTIFRRDLYLRTLFENGLNLENVHMFVFWGLSGK